MRTTVTIDDDVAALIEAERRRTGESFREALNRLLRRSTHGDAPAAAAAPALPLLPGRPLVDLRDVSSVLDEADEEHVREKRMY